MANKSIFVLGVRGFPNVQGGIETHCEQLYPFIAEHGYDITVLARRAYIKSDRLVGSINMISLWSPKRTGAEALVHTFIGVLYSILKRPDILHIHAIGPAIFTPLARLFGIKVVCTHHGFDYEREKWGGFATAVLRLGEFFAGKYSNTFIAVSEVAANRLEQIYKRRVFAISNGVIIRKIISSSSVLQELNIMNERYFLSVSRIVEEKRQLDIINAYLLIEDPKFKLVLVGGRGGGGDYYERVCEAARSSPNIIIAGVRTGDDLACLYYNASTFVHVSSLEGNPIVMLEAMSYGLPIIASDIPPNLELNLAPEEYVQLGNIYDIAGKMQRNQKMYPLRSQEKILRVKTEYSWESKSKEVMCIYDSLLKAP